MGSAAALEGNGQGDGEQGDGRAAPDGTEHGWPSGDDWWPAYLSPTRVLGSLFGEVLAHCLQHGVRRQLLSRGVQMDAVRLAHDRRRPSTAMASR